MCACFARTRARVLSAFYSQQTQQCRDIKKDSCGWDQAVTLRDSRRWILLTRAIQDNRQENNSQALALFGQPLLPTNITQSRLSSSSDWIITIDAQLPFLQLFKHLQNNVSPTYNLKQNYLFFFITVQACLVVLMTKNEFSLSSVKH